MKFIHMADLHLGKHLERFSLLEDQKYIFNEIVEIIKKEKPDALLLAGDIYDKQIPTVEAVNLLDDFLSKIAREKIPVLIISGNHDSADRLSFGSSLMKTSQIYFSPVYDGSIQCVSLKDEYGPVNFYLLPYIKPSSVRQIFPEEKINSFNDAVKLALSKIQVNKDERNVLVAHQFVTGAKTCESEELFVGGSENVDASLFDDFDYVALGHIHGPQKVGRDSIRYCGTPLKYSFSEVNHNKGLGLVVLGKKGDFNYTSIPLKPLHEMRKLKGSFEEIMYGPESKSSNKNDYLYITLTDEMDIPEGFGKLASVYENLVLMDYDNNRTRSSQDMTLLENMKTIKPLELFGEFFEKQNNKKLTEEQKAFMEKLIEDIWEAK
ncbi:MAG: exonuclease SbcCD subunit D [Treponema sp.]|nr:exonuclease SbcCD subunit D [Treponema sp.]